jgi:hypothetical protein
MTGDPVGCDDRKAFESVVDICLDKDSAGVKALSQIILAFALPALPTDGPARAAAELAQQQATASRSAGAVEAALALSATSRGTAEDYSLAMAPETPAMLQPHLLDLLRRQATQPAAGRTPRSTAR